MGRWEDAQIGELKYWQRPRVVWGEHDKQLSYFEHMKMWEDFGIADFELDMKDKSVLDIGCGPASSLLRMTNAACLSGIDPIEYGAAARRRYTAFGIDYRVSPAENLDREFGEHSMFDLTLCYNVLQHPENPEKIVKQMIHHSREIRIFEWLWIPTDNEHLWMLTPDMLLNWFQGCKIKYMATPRVTECGCTASAFVGIFEPTDLSKLDN